MSNNGDGIYRQLQSAHPRCERRQNENQRYRYAFRIRRHGFRSLRILSAAFIAEEKLMSPEQPSPLTVSPIK